MKIFAIRDEEIHPVRDLAFLFYFEKKKQFYIEIPEEEDPWDLPMILFDFAKKGAYTLDAEWSRIWVSQRIIPTDRQNLGMILRDNGLEEYDEYKLLLLCRGRCAQDSCYLAQIREEQLPPSISKRKNYKIDAIFPLSGQSAIIFFKDGQARFCEIEAMIEKEGNPQTIRRLKTYYDRLNSVRILAGGYGIDLNQGLFSVRDRTLYTEGTPLPFGMDEFRESLGNNLVDTQEAARILCCSRQYINTLVKNGSLKPIRQSEKSTLFLRSDLL